MRKLLILAGPEAFRIHHATQAKIRVNSGR
jgi:hypothetical protein